MRLIIRRRSEALLLLIIEAYIERLGGIGEGLLIGGPLSQNSGFVSGARICGDV